MPGSDRAAEPSIDREQQLEAFTAAARAVAEVVAELQRACVGVLTVLVEVLQSAPQQEDHALTR